MRGKQDHGREHQLRRAQTEAERVLWQHLRGRRLSGWKFRRQHRTGPYFADFACVEAGLVAELDGSQHLRQADHDLARTRFLEKEGYRVLRFWNDAVLQDMGAVLDSIVAALVPHPLARIKCAAGSSPRSRGAMPALGEGVSCAATTGPAGRR